MAKTGELLPKTSTGELQIENTVRFDGKISNNDLVEALVFEVEEELTQKQKLSRRRQKEIEKQSLELTKKYDEYLTTLSKNYKNKDVEKFCEQLASFTGKKVKPTFKAYIHKEEKKAASIKIRVHIYYEKLDGYDDRYNASLSKNFDGPKYPDLIKKLDLETAKLVKENTDLTKILSKINKQLAEMPRLKKGVKAKFVQTMLNKDITDKTKLYEELRSEVLNFKL